VLTGVKYDEEKERKAKWDAKQKELARIEEAKKREAEKGLLFFFIVITVMEVHISLCFTFMHCYLTMVNTRNISVWEYVFYVFQISKKYMTFYVF